MPAILILEKRPEGFVTVKSADGKRQFTMRTNQIFAETNIHFMVIGKCNTNFIVITTKESGNGLAVYVTNYAAKGGESLSIAVRALRMKLDLLFLKELAKAMRDQRDRAEGGAPREEAEARVWRAINALNPPEALLAGKAQAD